MLLALIFKTLLKIVLILTSFLKVGHQYKEWIHFSTIALY